MEFDSIAPLSEWPTDQLRRAYRLIGISALQLEANGETGQLTANRRAEATLLGEELLRRGVF